MVDPGAISSSLLCGLRVQQPEAWQRLARLYGPLVYRWCLRAGLQENDAEDVVQEVFCTVAARLASFRREREQDTFRGWVWRITRNKIGDHYRRRRSQPAAAGGSAAFEQLGRLPADKSDSLPAAMSSEVGELYRRALNLVRVEFAENTWEAFWRIVVGGRRPADVAAELGMSVNAAYLAKSRILRRLREELGEAPE